MSIQLSDFDRWVRSILDFRTYAGIDSAINGLQVARKNREISRVAFAVDASMETFRRAVQARADLLFVHHGLFWGAQMPITGGHYDRIRYLVENDLALYAVHLPLDAHPEFGNNAGIARALNLGDLLPFGHHKSIPVGLRGRLPEPLTLDELIEAVWSNRKNMLSILPFGGQTIRTVGIVSGGGTRMIDEAIDIGLDIFITGDADHTIYHRCLEAGIHVLCAGHYLSEIFGPRAMMNHFAETVGLHAEYIDLPTGL